MPHKLEAGQYAQLSKFITAISNRDTVTLACHFSLPDQVISEIYHLIPTYFSTGTKLSAPSNTTQYNETYAPLITTYEIGNGDIAVECFILESNEPSEAILHISFFAATPNKLNYEFINS